MPRLAALLLLIAACSSPGGDDPSDITLQYIEAIEGRDIDGLIAVFHPDNEGEAELRAEADLVFELFAPHAALMRELLDSGAEFAFGEPGPNSPRGDRLAVLEYDCGDDTTPQSCFFETLRFEGRWYVSDVD